MSNLPVIIIGGGGHASVLVDIIKKQKREIKAIISHADVSQRTIFNGIKILHSDHDVLQFSPAEIEMVNGIGASPRSVLRKDITTKYIDWGFKFATIIADNAYISDNVEIAQGGQVLSRAVIHPGVKIHSHSVINTAAIIEHDCVIGSNNFISPGAVLCGQVITGADVFVGANATIIQNINIADKAIVGAGAVLTQSLEVGEICYPAKINIK